MKDPMKTTVTTKENGITVDSHTWNLSPDKAMEAELATCFEWGGYTVGHNSMAMSLWQTGKTLAHLDRNYVLDCDMSQL